MATLPQIRDRIITKFQSLPTQREKLEFLYQVESRLRDIHNTRGAQFTAGTITKVQWETFLSQWFIVSERVSERIAILRDKVFSQDYLLTIPKDERGEVNTVIWNKKKAELKNAVAYKTDIDTIWQT